MLKENKLLIISVLAIITITTVIGWYGTQGITDSQSLDSQKTILISSILFGKYIEFSTVNEEKYLLLEYANGRSDVAIWINGEKLDNLGNYTAQFSNSYSIHETDGVLIGINTKKDKIVKRISVNIETEDITGGDIKIYNSYQEAKKNIDKLKSFELYQFKFEEIIT